MKAIVYRPSRNGCLAVEDVEKPEVSGNELLVKVRAALVTASDATMTGGFQMVKLLAKGPKPKEPIPGVEFAGIVEATGPEVRRFKAGDRVVGSSLGFGAWAEYVRVRENDSLARMPAAMDYAEAAGFGDGGITALLFLQELGSIRKGMQVLVNGASGAVGTYAVQLAKQFGAQVTAVCGSSNIELVRSLGADEVIVYTGEDFTMANHLYDIVFDAVGKSSFARCKRVLQENGAYLTTVPMPGVLLRKLWPAARSGKRALFMATGLAKPERRAAGLRLLAELADAGALRSVVDRVYPLEQVSEALHYVAAGHKRGSVVVTL